MFQARLVLELRHQINVLEVSGNASIDNGLVTSGTYSTQYGASPEIFANGDNHNGGGIAISDDGGFYDYNDGWVTFNASTGLKIAGNNGNTSNGQLDVQGTLQVNDGTAQPGYVFTASNTSGNGSWQPGGAGALSPGTGISFNGNTINSVWTANGNNIYNNNSGFVGVGTNSPSVLLDVENGTTSPAFKLVDGTQSAGYVLTSDANGNANWQVNVGGLGDSIWSESNGGIYPTSINNRLGIGTATPNDALQVASGLIRFNDYGVRNQFKIPNSCSGYWLPSNFGDTSSTSYWHSGLYGMDYSGGCGDEWFIAETDRDGNEYSTLVIAQGNDAQDDIALMPSGYVGIGPINPQAMLEVDVNYHSNNSKAFRIYQTQYNYETFSVTPKGRTQISAYDDYSGAGPALTVNQNGSNAGSALTVNQNGNHALPSLVTSGGYVGINTASPSVMLDVENGTTSPSFKLVDGTQSQGYVLTSDANGNASWQANAGGAGDTIWSESNAAIYPTSVNNRLGVGTTSPNEMLEVNGNLRFSNGANVYVATPGAYTNGGALTVKAGDGGPNGYGTSGGDLVLQAGNNWNAGGSGAAGNVRIYAGSNNLGSDNLGYILFYSGDPQTERMRIDPAGNIGIGTVSPGYNLEVAGNASVDNGLVTSGNYTTQYGASPEIFANGDNHVGGGIAISDDGGFYDYNDAWVTFNGSTGLKIAGNNGNTSSGQLNVQGTLQVNDGTAQTGYVFTSNNTTGNGSWQALPSLNTGFSANGALQSVPTGAVTPVIYTNVVFDDGSNYNAGTGPYTAPVSGVYNFSFNVGYGPFAVAAETDLILTVNGTPVASNTGTSSTTGAFANAFAVDVKLAAGDQVTVNALQESGSTVTLGGPPVYTTFSGHRIY